MTDRFDRRWGCRSPRYRLAETITAATARVRPLGVEVTTAGEALPVVFAHCTNRNTAPTMGFLDNRYRPYPPSTSCPPHSSSKPRTWRAGPSRRTHSFPQGNLSFQYFCDKLQGFLPKRTATSLLHPHLSLAGMEQATEVDAAQQGLCSSFPGFLERLLHGVHQIYVDLARVSP